MVCITFDRCNEHGPYGIHPDDRKSVYLHRDSEIKPKLGETYECQLYINGFPYIKNYFAIPVERVPDEDDVVVEVPTVIEEPEVESIDIDVPVPVGIPDNGEVVYLGDDTIGSTRFSDGNYRVMRSFDGRVIRMIPDDNGMIGCADNRITVCGIGVLFGDTPCRMSVSENERFTEMTIGE